MRDVPLLHRQLKLREVLSKTMSDIQFNDHFTGVTAFRRARLAAPS